MVKFEALYIPCNIDLCDESKLMKERNGVDVVDNDELERLTTRTRREACDDA